MQAGSAPAAPQQGSVSEGNKQLQTNKQDDVRDVSQQNPSVCQHHLQIGKQPFFLFVALHSVTAGSLRR
jgi:hypothetical protein